ncbi:MAG: bifunctional adenosylcobinamide kinase/adenosylcobinamide-phosphate guanylyltransferase [Actinobacteria bacterium]|nr:MAG: bifunctional adenosylcobinamide kinase/adenosylcobinamide-phosphate guanylyltransferase [Actinomycetota bacterium]
MTLVVLVGGARSGKSTLAVERAAAEGAPVTFIATGEAGDEEMAARIALHRAERPTDWTTIEEPVDVRGAIDSVPTGDTVIVDCLSLWVANGGDGAVLAPRAGLTIAVTNEVGLGIVPENALARAYRDDLGRVNASWVDAADEAYFVVAGRMLRLS